MSRGSLPFWTQRGVGREHAARRQLRLLHLQRLPPARGRLRRGADRRPQRHGLLARALALGLRRDRALPGTGPSRALARLRRLLGHPALQRDPGARHLSRPPGSRTRARRDGRERPDGDARTPQPGPASRQRAVRGHPAGLLGRALPLARGHRPARVRGPRDRLDRRRGGDGDRASQPPAVGGAVPSRVGRQRARPGGRRELLRARAPAQDPAPRRRARRRQAAAPVAAAGLRAAADSRVSSCACARSPASRPTEPLFQRLFGSAEHAFWLDSADAPTRARAALLPRHQRGPRSLRARVRRRGGDGAHAQRRGEQDRARSRSSTC